MQLKFLKQYKNKIVLVTGVSGQIGKYISRFFLNLGCTVYGIDLKTIKINSNKFIFKQLDISDEIKTKNFITKIYKKHKKIDIIINNAAVSFKTNFKYRTYDELIKTIDVNLLSSINIIKNIAQNHNKKLICKIINIGSIYGVRSPDFKIYDDRNNMNSEIYGASKAGIIQITKYFAVLLAKKNIIINCISPGGLENKNIQKKNLLTTTLKRFLWVVCAEKKIWRWLYYISQVPKRITQLDKTLS